MAASLIVLSSILFAYIWLKFTSNSLGFHLTVYDFFKWGKFEDDIQVQFIQALRLAYSDLKEYRKNKRRWEELGHSPEEEIEKREIRELLVFFEIKYRLDDRRPFEHGESIFKKIFQEFEQKNSEYLLQRYELRRETEMYEERYRKFQVYLQGEIFFGHISCSPYYEHKNYERQPHIFALLVMRHEGKTFVVKFKRVDSRISVSANCRITSKSQILAFFKSYFPFETDFVVNDLVDVTESLEDLNNIDLNYLSDLLRTAGVA